MTIPKTHDEIQRQTKILDEIDRQIIIQYDCGVDKAPEDERRVYLRGWLDAEQLIGSKADPDLFSSLICNDCGHRKEGHTRPIETGWPICYITGCKCMTQYFESNK